MRNLQKLNALERIAPFLEIDHSSQCWVWTRSVAHHGYGQVSIHGRRQMVHRAMYEFHKGPIPSGMQLDHLCRNHRCVNPEHLEPVTNRENQLRGLKGALKTHCANGHPYTGQNKYVHLENGHVRSRCRICNGSYGRS